MIKIESFSFMHEGDIFDVEIQYRLPRAKVTVRYGHAEICLSVRQGIVSKQKLVEMLATSILLSEKGESVLKLSPAVQETRNKIYRDEHC